MVEQCVDVHGPLICWLSFVWRCSQAGGGLLCRQQFLPFGTIHVIITGEQLTIAAFTFRHWFLWFRCCWGITFWLEFVASTHRISRHHYSTNTNPPGLNLCQDCAPAQSRTRGVPLSGRDRETVLDMEQAVEIRAKDVSAIDAKKYASLRMFEQERTISFLCYQWVIKIPFNLFSCRWAACR